LTLLLTYAAYVVVPLVHTAAGAAERCVVCEAAAHDGAVLLADCDGPCHDPTHHHHHHSSHDPDHCIICQSHAASQLAESSYSTDSGATTSVHRVPLVLFATSSVNRVRPDAPRGPPTFAFSA